MLFADVVRSMAIAAALDIERLREVMTELLERTAAVARRYGGTVEYNGDGVMALFGAPVALEDHALRACMAALDMQDEARRLAAEVQRRDGVDVSVRVGLNSGQVIAGRIGSGVLGYAATGETVGFAQRIESVAPAGGVLLSDYTARLVEHRTELSDFQWLHVKGSDEPVRARRLLAIRQSLAERAEVSLVGRHREMAALDAQMDRAVGGQGGVVRIAGPPGIGKSRLAREAAALAARRGIEVRWTFCESHTAEVPFHAVAQLLRAATGAADLEGQAARDRVRAALPHADPVDLLLFDDLLGIADPGEPLPQIDPDARRRRFTTLVNSASLSRTTPVLLVIEDAHWIDPVSESMMADFLAVIARTPALVLITYRPDYDGALARIPGAQAVVLLPLADSDTQALIVALLGTDPSVADLGRIIGARAAGNPFFTEEIVRELVQRGVLTGERGAYVCATDVGELSVPATIQAAITARVDRLSEPAKRTLHAAAVIGARFGPDILITLGIEPAFDELLRVELIDQVRLTPTPEYDFRHPLIKAVAYESQLKSARSEWHRRLAAVIQARAPESADENAALIAEHLYAAGDLHAAYGWNMRAAAWSINRDVGAARVNWERACRIADRIPDGDGQLAMRIAPRTMLCVTDWQAEVVQDSWGRFEELRTLCTAAGDRVSLAIGMTGLASELLYAGRPGEGSRLASEQMELLDSIGDPALTLGLAFVAFANWFNSGDIDAIATWSDRLVELADGNPTLGSVFGIVSPLAISLVFRGLAGWWLGRPRWRQDLEDAVAMARRAGPSAFALVTVWAYGALLYGVLRADDAAIRIIEQAAQEAEAASNDFSVIGSKFGLAVALLHATGDADRARGLGLMVQARDKWLPERSPSLVPLATVCAAREYARLGDRDAAINQMRNAVNELREAHRIGWIVCCTAILAETLMERGSDADLLESETLIAQLAELEPAGIVRITLLRLRALLAAAHGDDAGYRDLSADYLDLAGSLGYEGHREWAAGMAAAIGSHE
ncbi:AAA family ATPase [Mycobacterium sp. DL592]|uniref:ATP-binding protein n=1 Tax=Mycobacterium sp. DL592 TaxID=2675524 RepID=UPI00352E2B4C